MSILIKGAEMPKSCGECPCICLNWSDIGCAITASRTNDVESRLPDCPLVEIPPHGRLIDISKMKIETNGCRVATVTPELLEEWLDAQPTVIESEDE